MERSRERVLPSIAIAAEGQEVRGDQRDSAKFDLYVNKNCILH